MWKAERNLGLLVWSGQLHEGDTLHVTYGAFSEVHVYRMQQLGSHLWFKRVRQADHPSPTHVITGVLYRVALHNQPMWYVKNFLEKYVFDIPHAI